MTTRDDDFYANLYPQSVYRKTTEKFLETALRPLELELPSVKSASIAEKDAIRASIDTLYHQIALEMVGEATDTTSQESLMKSIYKDLGL